MIYDLIMGESWSDVIPEFWDFATGRHVLDDVMESDDATRGNQRAVLFKIAFDAFVGVIAIDE